MLAFVDLASRVPRDHPLRAIKRWTDEALVGLSPELDRMYAEDGRPSIPRRHGASHPRHNTSRWINASLTRTPVLPRVY